MSDPLARAACKNKPEYDWYANTVAETNRAITICRVCPVSKACCEEADQRREQWGVWGGISRSSKSSVKRKHRAAMETIWETGKQPVKKPERRKPVTPKPTPETNVVDIHEKIRLRSAEGYA